ncbi:MAG: MarR family transcriptional regulator [Curvibacter sp.]|nr:MarR family transcriptional regulator [Curvibacter sp.]
MSDARMPDAVDAILAQWRRERPDLDASPMGPIGRLKRCEMLLRQRLDEKFAEFGLAGWEFDMLATLRRSGEPFCLTPTALFSTMMVSSGTMTHRLKGLEASGWVRRLAHPEDARSTLVQLTEPGRALIDRAVEAHVAHERALLAAFDEAGLQALDAALARLMASLSGA